MSHLDCSDIDFSHILEKVKFYQKDIFKFTRDLIRLKGGSGNEGNAIKRTQQEMLKLNFDKVSIDPLGNVLGYIGNGPHLIAFDGHLDVVSEGDRTQWDYDPYEGYEDDKKIIGRGSTDMKGAVASIVYAAKIIKDLDLNNQITLLVTGTVAEEDCDGLCWKYIIEENGIKPEFVVLAEPSDDKICIAQKGRMEIKIVVKGKSAHASIPEKGENAIYKMTNIINELLLLDKELPVDNLLGKGCLTVSEIKSESPSRCAVPDICSISIDRRLTFGEKSEDALNQVKNLPSVLAAKAQVEIYYYDTPSYTGLEYFQKCSFNPWKIDLEHNLTQSFIEAYRYLFKKEPKIDFWPFSSNGVSIMGLHNIPVIGYGPGELKYAHCPNEMVKKEALIKSTALYATVPSIYEKIIKEKNI